MDDNLLTMPPLSSSVSLASDIYYLIASLAIAKTPLKGYCNKQCTTGAILVQDQHIIAIGYDSPKTGEWAEEMALAQVDYCAQGASLYTSMAPTRLSTRSVIPAIINSQIARLVYGYCEPVIPSNSLQQLQHANIQCIYVRIPELLRFYAPYRFAEVIL